MMKPKSRMLPSYPAAVRYNRLGMPIAAHWNSALFISGFVINSSFVIRIWSFTLAFVIWISSFFYAAMAWRK